jgi:hypothetical protein
MPMIIWGIFDRQKYYLVKRPSKFMLGLEKRSMASKVF